MGKRKLSRQQQWRIQKIQQEKLKRVRNKHHQLLENIEIIDQVQHTGQVISHYGLTLDIKDKETSQLVRCTLRQNIEPLVCGDDITWQNINDIDDAEQIRGVVTALSPRKTVLARPDFSGQMKAIAANIDQILIIAAPVPEFNPGLIDRYLVAAELSAITPVIVLNKTDVLTPESSAALAPSIQNYRDIGYRVIKTNTIDKHGMSALYQQLSQKTSVLVGQSGVGKTSLINTLIPKTNAKTGEISSSTAKGTHTTSVSKMYTMETQEMHHAHLIDSPGVREFGLWNIQPEDTIRGFRELYQLSLDCRFRDCRHTNEPGCAILQGLDKGTISQRRWDSYHRIMDSLSG